LNSRKKEKNTIKPTYPPPHTKLLTATMASKTANLDLNCLTIAELEAIAHDKMDKQTLRLRQI
jgi:hypothetical protein